MGPTKRKSNARRPARPSAPAAPGSAERRAEQAERVAVPVRGTLLGLSPEGELLISLAGGEEVRAAEHLLELSRAALLDAVRERAPVLVAFVGGDPDAPVVLGLLRRGIAAPGEEASSGTERRLELRATERLTLACGAAAIELTKDGRVEVRGTDVATESAGSIKLKGGSVEIN
ncbi:MAG: hypothetical protein HY908_21325 [Myxococcales bacterium]|nr:hypothetical protein [Myxococcales bacterium]